MAFADRFWSHVDRGADDACWPWTAATSHQGYGLFTVSPGHQRTAHRMAYELTHGSFDDVLKVCHTCDHPPCCNPAHLFLGTNQANTDDIMRKGRHPHGASHGLAKLTEEDVRAIRQAYANDEASQTALASSYGVHQTIISDVVRRITWKHLP